MEPKARGHRFPKGDKERSTSGALTRAMISWVRDTLGEPGVRQLLAVAGLSRPLRELEDETGWVAYRESGLLLDAAIAVSGRPDASRRIGEEVVRGMMSTEVGALLRSLGSPSEVIRNVVASGVKFSAAVGLEVLHVEECHAVLCSRTLLSAPREKKECDFMSGIFSMVPVIFGMDPAEVWETECQRWGDSRCVYNMAWKVDSGIANDPLRRIAHLEVELIDLNKRFESLQSMATELVSADDIEEVLTLVMRRAGVAVRASRYLLAVQLGSKLSIHSDGFTADEAEILAGEVLAGEPDDHGGSRLIVDVASRGRHYGRLAAVFPTGGSFFPQERDLLSAYAGHAAAVLDTATALEEVRRQNRTSAALLALAHDLSEATTSHEVAARLVEAVTKVVDCDSAGVLLWNIQEGRLRLAANVDMPESAVEILSGPGIGVEDTEAMARMLDHPEPSFYDYESADDYHRQFITPGRSSLAIVPIVWGGTFFGVVVAGIHRPLVEIRQDGEVVERLSGIAHQAGTALENAALLDQIRHQALHDSLTGLPNRVLLHDRARQALLDTDRTYDRVALAFLDVDRFKKINDTLGHRGGDELLIQVGRRLGQGLRASDTVVRLGGDEFVVLMPHVRQAADAFALAEKIAESMAASFTVGGLEIFVTVSMGVSVSGEGGGGYEDLLKQADVAMYQAKALGGGHIHVYEESKDALTGDDLALECELHSAVTGGELRVVYQTQVDLSTGGVVGVEALVRWEHPTRGM
ncbi:MAG: diguanylate cyclase domain-containing protein, partial [Acidimicrobiales bacterium]